MSNSIRMLNVMRIAFLRVCWLPAPLRMTAGRVVPTHHTSCLRRLRTLPKLSVLAREAFVCDNHALRTRHTERFDLQKGLRDRNSPTCTLSQNGYGDSPVSNYEAAAVLAERGKHLLTKCMCFRCFSHNTTRFGVQKRT